jgi:predicted secreted hydrolase
MNRRWALLQLGAWLLPACRPGEPFADDRATPTGVRFLAQGDTAGFARAIEPREFKFPADHGSHPEFRTEWWYFTGNVFDRSNRHYGFELTLFRIGLSPQMSLGRASAWASNQIWMAHFGFTDTHSGTFLARERLSRGSLGTAGAQAEPFRVWVEDWEVDAPSGQFDGGLRLRASAGDASIQLLLTASKEPVPQGNGGLDAKGGTPGNASYYYSLPRFSVSGTVNGDKAVEGLAWMDREWSTSALEDGVTGWDWFALQLSDGSDLMIYRLRDEVGDANAYSSGSLVREDGSVVRLDATDFVIQPNRYWSSQSTGVRYPVAWDLEIPALGLRLAVSPQVEAQELELSVRYWEGAVRVAGSAGGKEISGYGYLELAGY